MISGLSHCAGVVLAEKQVARLKHIEFVPLEPGKALVVLVGEDQNVENRIINLPAGIPPSALQEASNYLNTHIRGLTIAEARARSRRSERRQGRTRHLDAEGRQGGARRVVGRADDRKSLIVRGQANLLKDLTASKTWSASASCSTIWSESATLFSSSALPRTPTACAFSSARRTSCSRCRDRRLSWRRSTTSAQHRRRSGRHRPDPHQLRAHYSDGRLHRQTDRAPDPMTIHA